ncbi:MAG TPA: tRNA pseudouridine(55) synthase TruB [Chloroflexota bacterium]|nr:tRNA pseudouridine(55) synthase TruB [Chloroflexota bacterium]
MVDGVSGVLSVDKPAGLTSHDVVARTRRLSGQRAVGHAGTLDPLATGVLVLLMGRATALAPYATAQRKIYAAEVVLGCATETDDAEGAVTRTAPVPSLEPGRLEAVLKSFVGSQMQQPPVYSAVKQGGVRAYARARAGTQVELPGRPVIIHSIDLLDYSDGRLTLRVETGPGTYIRSLARDIGHRLGTAAYLHTLVRLASGHCHLRDSVALDHLNGDNLRHHVLPMDSVLTSLPAVFLQREQARQARHGMAVPMARFEVVPTMGAVRLYDHQGAFFALAKPSGSRWKPFRVLDPA